MRSSKLSHKYMQVYHVVKFYIKFFVKSYKIQFKFFKKFEGNLQRPRCDIIKLYRAIELNDKLRD